MGRQTRLECLRVESRFIIRQISVMCLPAESRALPLFGNKVIHRVIHSLWTVGNAVGRGEKTDPRVLSSAPSTYILPHKKYTLK
jgi:hypothetical protein